MGWAALSFTLWSALTVPRLPAAGSVCLDRGRSAPHAGSARAIQALAQAREGEHITDRTGRLANRRQP